MNHQTFVTTSRGLERSSLPMRLYEKAKQLGTWNPSEIDFTQDIHDWANLSDREREVFLHLTSLFQAGEEAVTLDLLPLIMVVAQEGRLEEEMYLTTFLFEEAKHTDFFRRFFDEVAAYTGDLSQFTSDNYREIVYQALPQALSRLLTDSSPAAQVEASVTYNMIVEGVLAETGYHAYFTILERNDLMPGMRRGISLLKLDESRHIAYGIYLLSRLLAQDNSLWQVMENKMNALLPQAIGVVGDIFASYDPMPFGLVADDFIEYAMDQFSKRYERLEKARGSTLDEIDRASGQAINTV